MTTSPHTGASDRRAEDPGSPLVVAIDNGSQSTKVSIVDPAGRVLSVGRRALRPSAHPAPGRVEHPGDDLWDSIVAACREALERFTGDPARIVGIGLCTIRFCRALVGADGRLVSPVMSWMDERLSRPYEHDDERVAFVTTSSGYLAGRLVGRVVDMAGNTQGRWPVDTDTWRWSDDEAVLAREGVPRRLLPPLALPGDELGRVTAEAARATGMPAGLPVFATSNDKAVEALGSGLLDGDELLLSLGTYVATMTPGEPGYAPQAHRDVWRNFGATPGSTLYESDGIRRGMWTVSWFRDLVYGHDLDAPDGEREAELESGAADVEPGCGGLVAALDWLAPSDEPTRRGAFIGFDGTQGRFAMYRAVLEALALTMADHAAAMGRALGRAPRALVVSGGGARSVLLLRILAATFDLPVRRTEMPDAAGLGAAITAAVGAGVHESFASAVASMVRVERRIEPEPALIAAYGPVAARHRAVRAGLARLLAEIDAGG